MCDHGAFLADDRQPRPDFFELPGNIRSGSRICTPFTPWSQVITSALLRDSPRSVHRPPLG
jgi:hypothetical protein